MFQILQNTDFFHGIDIREHIGAHGEIIEIYIFALFFLIEV